MAQEMIMTEGKLNDVLETCEDVIGQSPRAGIHKRIWLTELEHIKGLKTLADKWASMIESSIFKMAYGNWIKVDGITLYLED